MSEWVKLCRRADLPPEGAAKEFTIGDRTLCVATVKGKPLALDNICPHRGGPLADGTIECGKVVCPWHQWEFDLTTGAATDAPDVAAITYTLRIDGDDVLVNLQ